MDELKSLIGKGVREAAHKWLNDQTVARGWYSVPNDVFAQGALTAIEQAGFVVVPKEPTEAMIEAGEELIPVARGTESRRGTPNPEDVFAAMIEAATRDESHDLSK